MRTMDLVRVIAKGLIEHEGFWSVVMVDTETLAVAGVDGTRFVISVRTETEGEQDG